MAGGIPPVSFMKNLSNPATQTIWKKYLRELALGLASLCSLYSPQIVALGGGLSACYPAFPQDVATHLSSLRWKPHPETTVCAATFLNDAGILGAAALID